MRYFATKRFSFLAIKEKIWMKKKNFNGKAQRRGEKSV
jgi:hypothetical protein